MSRFVAWTSALLIATGLVACDPGPGPGNNADAGIQEYELAVSRFNADGTLDTTFGAGGTARIDLGPGAENLHETLWAMDRDAQDRLVLFGSRKGDGTRDDSDRVVVRLTADGALDTEFATEGIHALNLANLGDNARGGVVLPDGAILSSGYTRQTTGVGAQDANAIVLVRLDGDGAPDPAFGYQGVVNNNPFAAEGLTPWGMAEAYGVRLQPAQGSGAHRYVTAGYGRSDGSSSADVNVVSFRYTASGELDTTWGNNGVVEVDVAEDADRGRNLVVLPDNSVLIVGSATPVAGNIDAMVVDLTEDGDTRAVVRHDFGRPDEALYGAAVSPTGSWSGAVGYVAGPVAGADQDDDALVWLHQTGAPPVANPVALSESGNDKLWAAAFDASDKLNAAGFIEEAGDSRMVVARFNTDGTLDTSFGTGGVASLNLSPTGKGEVARAVVVQSSGKIVIGGLVEKN